MQGNINKGKLLLKKVDVMEKTERGVILPVFNSKQRTSEVMIVGECCETKVGETIYHLNEGVRVHIDGEDYYLINESDVLYRL